MSPVEKYKRISVIDLPQKSIEVDEWGAVRFELAHAINPSQFYAYAKIDNHEAYVQLDEQINAYYSTREAKLRDYAAYVNYEFVCERALCVSKSSKNGHFYRVQVKFYRQCEKSRDKSAERATSYVLVTFVDYGIAERAVLADLFPIAAEFTTLAPYCVPCRLDLVQPVNDIVENTWTDEAVHFFANQLTRHGKCEFQALFNADEQFIRVGFLESLPLIISLNDSFKVSSLLIL